MSGTPETRVAHRREEPRGWLSKLDSDGGRTKR